MVDIPYAIFEYLHNQIISFKEKPTYRYNSNAGIYIIKRELIYKIPKNKFYDITDMIKELLLKNIKIINDPITGFWIDIGSQVDFSRAKELVKYMKIR